MNNKERAVIDAALAFACCPDAGGYRDGPAIEDCNEELIRAVDAYIGKSVSSPPYPNHWTLEQMYKKVRKIIKRRPKSE